MIQIHLGWYLGTESMSREYSHSILMTVIRSNNWYEIRSTSTALANFQLNELILTKIFWFQMNISAIGFSPMINAVQRMHGHEEYLNADTYLNGIEVYRNIITKFGSVEWFLSIKFKRCFILIVIIFFDVWIRSIKPLSSKKVKLPISCK